ncbi:MAG: MFS transporter, partial [Raoultibacter sp.]
MGSKAEHDKLPLYRWVILVIASLLIFMTSYVQFQISSLSSLIIPQFNLDAVEFSSLLLAPLLSGVFLSIPSGVLCDRFGPRTVVGVATAFSVAAAFVRIFAGDYLTLFGTMVVLGVCPAVLQASLIKVFCVWFKGDSDFAMGIYFASASVGIACSQATSNLFGSLEAAFLTSSLVFLGCGIAWVVLARDVPAGEAPPPRESLSQYLRVATSSKSVWLIAAAVGLGMATSTAYMGLFPQALIDTHAFNP